MKAKDQPRFDIGTLREMAGEKVFARGQAYHDAGQVNILAIEPGRVLAQVAGTEDYRTVLRGCGAKIEGECSCPAFEDWGFCKHMVATAFAANAAGDNGAADGAGALGRIRDHLKARGVDALVEMIVELAEWDPALLRKLDMAADAASEDETVLEPRYRKAINEVTRTRGFVDYGAAPRWASGVQMALESVADLIPAGRASLAFNLAEHAIARVEQAIEEIDDSDGHCGALLHQARDIHLDACRAVRPDPVKLARDLFTREMGDDYDTFYNAAALYADVLGETGLTEYSRLAAEAWKELPPLAGGNRAPTEFSGDYIRLKSILDFFAERDGDVEVRIAIRAKDLSSPRQYLQLAEFCLAQDRQEEALHHAEEGLWIFEDERPDKQLVFFTVDLLDQAGRRAEAEAHLWRAFEKDPSLELYKRLRSVGGEETRERAVAHLEAQLAEEKPAPWRDAADLLIRVLMEEKMFDAAWVIANENRASSGLKESLAKASETNHSRDALKVYADRVEELLRAGGNHNYEEAHRLITRMGALRGVPEQAAYVAGVKIRFRRKRNFMKLLE
uniref:SWIM zinc finger family protein n=1 Tax=Pararhizobium sp. IMCC3301 TaxID=3067904 RepID=UPI0027416BE2|nr:DUF6880 family protein [Pararhizobium sp. IMCC3301]